MNRTAIIFALTFLLTSCNLLENKKKKAIEICQKSKVQLQSDNVWEQLGFAIYGLTAGATWLDFANMLAKQDPNIKHDWTAEKTKEDGTYLVSFVDENGWGHRWEVTIEQQIVKHVNSNEYLCRKHGLSRFDPDGNFKITNIITNVVKIEKENNYYSKNESGKIVYVLEASVLNKTGKSLTSTDISGALKIIYKDKTIEGEIDWDSGFKTSISESNPWKQDTEIDFYIKTEGIEQIYLDYEPEYVFLEVNLKAEDPVGFSYDKVIEEYDLKSKWKSLK